MLFEWQQPVGTSLRMPDLLKINEVVFRDVKGPFKSEFIDEAMLLRILEMSCSHPSMLLLQSSIKGESLCR